MKPFIHDIFRSSRSLYLCKLLTISLLFIAFATVSYAQDTTATKKTKGETLRQKLEKHQYAGPKTHYPMASPEFLRKAKDATGQPVNFTDRVWFPGEWEEVKAIVVSPHYLYLVPGKEDDIRYAANPLFEGYAEYLFQPDLKSPAKKYDGGPYETFLDTDSLRFCLTRRVSLTVTSITWGICLSLQRTMALTSKANGIITASIPVPMPTTPSSTITSCSLASRLWVRTECLRLHGTVLTSNNCKTITKPLNAYHGAYYAFTLTNEVPYDDDMYNFEPEPLPKEDITFELDTSWLEEDRSSDTPTDIQEVYNHAEYVNDNAWYTIGGLRLSSRPSTKGFYIYRGKKIVIR